VEKEELQAVIPDHAEGFLPKDLKPATGRNTLPNILLKEGKNN
jgi:hypothetical protein